MPSRKSPSRVVCIKDAVAGDDPQGPPPHPAQPKAKGKFYGNQGVAAAIVRGHRRWVGKTSRWYGVPADWAEEQVVEAIQQRRAA